jgi:thioredoxin-related protein
MKYSMVMLVVAMVACAAPAQVKDSTAAVSGGKKFDPARDPAQDVSLAVKEATDSGKRILLDVGGDWCKWCKMLDKFFDSDTAVSDYLHSHFVVVKVNFSKENDNAAFLSHYPKIPGYPHFFVLESDGSLLHSQDTGLLEKGQGYDSEKIMAFLQHWTI